jgi:hypothetical protein
VVSKTEFEGCQAWRHWRDEQKKKGRGGVDPCDWCNLGWGTAACKVESGYADKEVPLPAKGGLCAKSKK